MYMTKTEEPKLKKWTREEYYKIAETGVFDGQHVELIKGEIFEMSPQKSEHAAVVAQLDKLLGSIFEPQGYSLRVQLPLDLGEDSEPEPDITVVAGEPMDYRDAHPTTAALIVEVAETTVRSDRAHKASLYAEAGIADYWIVNLVDRQLEIRRNPVPDPNQPYGFGYADVTILTAAHSVSPLAAPQAIVSVSDLLP
jgi:Uma2 family endonuclease